MSDLAAGDFLVGPRAVVVTPDSTGTTRDVLVERLGYQFTISMLATSTVAIIRP